MADARWPRSAIFCHDGRRPRRIIRCGWAGAGGLGVGSGARVFIGTGSYCFVLIPKCFQDPIKYRPYLAP
jgi:hypothetical protein